MGLRPKLLLALATAAAALSAAFAGVAPARATHVAPACRSGYYLNVSHHCVERPSASPSAPAGATAKCRDSTYSFSEHASGTCSHHCGVSRWIHHP